MELFNLISLAVIFGVAMLLLYRQGIFRFWCKTRLK